MACIAQSPSNMIFYRACIKALNFQGTSKNVTVFYVDYGRTETIDFKYLRKIKDDFGQMPSQAVACRLSNIEPPTGGAEDESKWPRMVAEAVEVGYLYCIQTGLFCFHIVATLGQTSPNVQRGFNYLKDSF